MKWHCHHTKTVDIYVKLETTAYITAARTSCHKTQGTHVFCSHLAAMHPTAVLLIQRIVRNDTGHQLQKFATNWITNSKMADKMAAVQGYGCISSVYISFQALQHITFRRMPASMLGFLVYLDRRIVASRSHLLAHEQHYVTYGA